jgi:Leucine-rich repeat (LRR) protein
MKKIVLLFIIILPFFGFNQEQEVVIDSTKVFKSLEEALENPEVVFHLKLNKKKLTEFPEGIFLLKKLITIDLSKNKISNVPMGIASLKNLKELKLNKNKFTQFPIAICELDGLHSLGLNQNSIVEIPPEIGKLKNLVYLDMWSNDLDVFPAELQQLKKLKEFDLRVIQLSDKQKKHLVFLLPKTKIEMSNSCNCAN